MLFKRIVAPVGIALAALSSSALGVIVEREITPEYIAKHKDEFQVKTAVDEGSIEFRFTRFVHEERHRAGKLVIRKGGRVVVAAPLLPSESKGRVSYTLTVSPDYTSESYLFLTEARWVEFTTIDANNKRATSVKPGYGDVRFRFSLQKFANSAGDSP